jgi:precorrin-6A/cobalt-precorrin-6A reductase
MILLFGGTSETAAIATALAEQGHEVLVSTATDAELDVGSHPHITRRCGRLASGAIQELIEARDIRCLIDASHPFATELQQTLAEIVSQTGIPFIRYQRRSGDYARDQLYEVDDHAEAASLMAEFAQTCLLTTGSRNLKPYVEVAERVGLMIYARILPHPESLAACDAVGLADKFRIPGRGPFSQEENRRLIKAKQIKVLITKDSGLRGGVGEKLEAARLEGCRVIMIRRPVVYSENCLICSDVQTLVVNTPVNSGGVKDK